jgi:uncharacterized membrane protein
MKAALSKIISSLRPNILLLATFVFVVVIALVVTLFNLATGDSSDEFLKGALVGLIGTGITALTSLGNNILEKDSSENDRIAQTPPTQE